MAQIVGNRALIEQAKGVLMVVYNIDADAAFDLLKEQSEQTNIKVRFLAEQLMPDFRSLCWSQIGCAAGFTSDDVSPTAGKCDNV